MKKSLLNKRNKWIFASGGTSRDLTYTLVTLFLLTYLQYTGLFQQVTQFIVLSVIIFLCRIWDAINDPLMGTIIANTKSRYGKYRPWILIGGVLNAIILVLMFSIRFSSGWQNVIFIGIMYLLWGMTYTINDISYWGLIPTLTQDKIERDKFTSLVVVFASIGQFISGGLIPVITPGKAVLMYKLVAIIWALIFMICQIIIFFGVRDNCDDKFRLSKEEAKNLEKEDNVTLKQMFKIIIKNKQLLVSAAALFFYSLASLILTSIGLNFFWFKFGYASNEFSKNGGLMMTIFTVVFALATIISQIIYPLLAKKWKRQTLIWVSFLTLFLGYIGFFLGSNLLNGVASFSVIITVSVLIFVGQGIMYMSFIIMLTNTIEYGEWLTGKNNSAVTFSLRPFVVKMAGAVQYVLTVLILIITGLYPMTQKVGFVEASMNMVKEGIEKDKIIDYVSSLEKEDEFKNEVIIILKDYNHKVKLSQEQITNYENKFKELSNKTLKASKQQVLGLSASMSLIPVFFCFIAWLFMKNKYIIDEELYETFLKDIAERKNPKPYKTKQTAWFKDSFMYQIYPISFKDSNGDGIGDLKGITQKLDYLKDLGINGIWLSPIYSSPMQDNGYDISDYKNINPILGTMKDFKEMLDEMHKRDIKLIMDLVINHTSSEHKWFKEAKKSVDSPYHNYYIWKDKPNNWTGFFGEKAWEYVPEVNKYYLHLFAKEQPDFNWENKKLRQEVKDIMKFWFDLGVDGFRCDVINLISKEQSFRNGRDLLFLKGKKYYINGPRLHEYLKELHDDVLSKYDVMTVGETVFTDLNDAIMITDPHRRELSMIFNFDHTSVDNYFGVKWFMRKFNLKRFRKILGNYQEGLDKFGWNSLFYENHDQRRSINRFGTDPNYEIEGAKMLANTMYFMKGTPFIYQGQEIGMKNWDVDNLDDFQDIETKNVLKALKKFPFSKKYIEKTIRNGSRDNARTPMQWDSSINAGFTSGKPWLPLNPNYKKINTVNSIKDQNSIFNYYKKMIKVRKEQELVKTGIYKDINPRSSKIYAYERRKDNELLLILSNFTKKERRISKLLKPYNNYSKKILLNNYTDFTKNKLKPYQGVILYLKKYDTY